jgi:hypothetical protein
MGARAPAARAKASAISIADANLRLGSRVSARSKKASIPGLSVVTISEGRRTDPAMMLLTMAPMPSPGKGSWPVRARNMTTPSDQRSLRPSISFAFWICSGLM